MEDNNEINQTVEKPKKKNGGLVGAFIIIIVLLLVLIGYLCYDKFLAKKDEPALPKEVEKKPDSQEPLDPNEKGTIKTGDKDNEEEPKLTENDSVNQYIDQKIIDNKSLNNSLGNNKKILEDATYLLANYRNSMMYIYLTKSCKLNELTNQQKLWMMYFYNKVSVDFDKTSAKTMLSSIQETYGKSFSINFENMGDDIGGIYDSTDIVYTYNSKTDRFDFSGNGGSMAMLFIDVIKPTKFEEKNNKYYITYKLILSADGVIFDAYQNIILDFANIEDWEEAHEQAKNNIDDLPEVTFVFEKEDGNLILTEFIK